jgi:membrane-associated protease RseP (regulator of RpoE activity)
MTQIRPVKSRWGLNLVLLVLTLFTTMMAGALLRGVDPLDTAFVPMGGAWFPVPTTVDWQAMVLGAPFALALLGILLVHEMGHYLAARRHRVRVTLPFFIPFPAYFSLVGTLGAFIRLKGPIMSRSVLFDIGAAGPLASFVVSIPVVFIGLALSGPVPGEAAPMTPFLIHFAGEAIGIGDGLLFRSAAVLFFGDEVGTRPILLHPLAFAGWLGLFVTALNLLPFGQLDGGHILFSVMGRAQRHVGRLFLLCLIPLGMLWWGWWFWGGAVLFLSRGRIEHPPVLGGLRPLGRHRRALAWMTFAIFLLTFAPVPVAL